MTPVESIIVTVIGTALGCTGLYTLIQFIIQRSDKKKEQASEVNKRLDKLEKQADIAERDSVRTQMLILMADFPEDEAELLKVAEHYFVGLKANWYMTAKFKKYCKQNHILLPAWFNAESEDQ